MSKRQPHGDSLGGNARLGSAGDALAERSAQRLAVLADQSGESAMRQ
jgi:hypothetical protein